MSETWPLPEFDDDDQPHFLFIITPPYSGSTAIAEIINTSYRTMILHPKAEGQWLVPGLCEPDRWEKDKEIDYRSVKATWLSVYQQVNRLTRNVDVVIEKSPPNMVRMEQISSQFRDVSFLANNRDPYASCASTLYRLYDADRFDSAKRMKVLSRLAQSWIERSEKIRELVLQLGIPLITYEKFCSDPASVKDALRTPDGVADSINPNADVVVKGYTVQPISDQNDRQIARLREGELEHIRGALRSSDALLNFFGYSLGQ